MSDEQSNEPEKFEKVDLHLNQLHRFVRLSVHDDWLQCVICREDVNTGFELFLSDDAHFLQTVVLCDNCIKRSKKEKWITETVK